MERLPQPENQLPKNARRFAIEVRGSTFKFLELKAGKPSDVLLVHFPGFREDGPHYAVSMHRELGQVHDTLALDGYGETFSRELLVEALSRAIQQTGKQKIILHGTSFGSSVVYDLISDPVAKDFLKSAHVFGAILETPFLDKQHLKSRTRLLPDRSFMRGAEMLDRIIGNARSLGSQQEGSVDLPKSQQRSLLQEAIREKTVEGRTITIPIHVVLAENENLSDNAKIIKTLESQATEISTSTVKSAEESGHRIADEEYEPMWKKERAFMDRLEGKVKAS